MKQVMQIRRRWPESALLALTLVSAANSYSKAPDNIDTLSKQMLLTEEVLATALRNASEELHVKRVESHYLADQGVIMRMNVTPPMIRIISGEDSLKIDANFERLNQIPEIVHEILQELDIEVPAEAHAEEVEELRSLRSEQRQVRKEQRELRSNLRRLRREMVRQGEQERIAAEREVTALEQELKTLEAEYEALNGDVERHYDRLDEIKQEARNQKTAVEATAKKASNALLDMSIVSAVCQYGKTLSALDDEEHISIVVETRGTDRHFVFEMSDVNDCGKDEINSEELSEAAWIY